MIDRLKRIITDINLFSTLVVQVPLRRYQITPANAVIQSCLRGAGLDLLWVFPRQSGKDEAIAQLCVFLLTLFQRTEASIVHVYPTLAQCQTGITRLERRLQNRFTHGNWWSKNRPPRRGIGSAQVAFFSGHPQTKPEGATASLLLIINEVQDQLEPVIERRFMPMRASTNATALFVGTVRTTSDYLWRTKTRLEALQAQDGIQRVFSITPDQIAPDNPPYAAFVANQVALKGRQHPTVKTELFNEPLDSAAGLFSARRLQLMRGAHARLSGPQPGETYLATIDVGGQDEQATAAFADLANPGRDYTVCSIFRVVYPPVNEGIEGGDQAGWPGYLGPRYELVDVLCDQGTRHFQDMPGRPSLFSHLLAYLNHWQVSAIVCDASGVGQGIADALSRALQRAVLRFDFAGPGKKARLGADFLAMIETGRFKHYRDEDEDAFWFFEQARFCSYQLAEGQPLERALKWSVPPTVRTTAPDGTSQPVHDDRLLSAALSAEADRAVRAGELFFSAGASTVITPSKKEEGWY